MLSDNLIGIFIHARRHRSQSSFLSTLLKGPTFKTVTSEKSKNK